MSIDKKVFEGLQTLVQLQKQGLIFSNIKDEYYIFVRGRETYFTEVKDDHNIKNLEGKRLFNVMWAYAPREV